MWAEIERAHRVRERSLNLCTRALRLRTEHESASEQLHALILLLETTRTRLDIDRARLAELSRVLAHEEPRGSASGAPTIMRANPQPGATKAIAGRHLARENPGVRTADLLRRA